MEKQITIRSIGDKVYFLSSKEPSFGVVKSRILCENDRIIYRVLSSKSHKEYQGDEVTQEQLFSTKDELLEYFKKILHEL